MPVRADVFGLAATLYGTEPLPVPLVAPVSVTQLAFETADQVQPLPAVTPTLPVAAPDPTDCPVEFKVGAHVPWNEKPLETALAVEPWWSPDPDALVQDAVEISVQVNGKMRARVTVPANATQEVAVEIALRDDNVRKFVDGKPIRKAIYVPGKLANLVV